MSARSGLRSTLPTSGGLPPGRNSSRVAGNALNRCWFCAVWSWKVRSTTKPCRASRSAGRSTSPRFLFPHLSSAACQVIGVPGTPTDRPLVTASSNGIGLPFSTNRSSRAEFGAVSRPSIVSTLPVRAS